MSQPELAFRQPNSASKQEILAFAKRFYGAGESVINGSGGLDFYPTFEEWLRYLERVESGEEEGFVPSRIWFAYEEGGEEPVGVLDIRPTLPREKEQFGHIGYSTAPGCRGKGIASAMARWGTARLHEAGVETVIACCYESNEPSRKTLEASGFSQAGVYTEPDSGKRVLIYHHSG